MKINKQARRDGKTFFRACLVDGQLDETLARDVVRKVVQTKPRGYLAALTHFQRLLKLHIESRTATVENAVPTPPELQSGIQGALEKRYGRGLNVRHAVNARLLGGLRVRVGSDVYDGSVQARLESLRNAF